VPLLQDRDSAIFCEGFKAGTLQGKECLEDLFNCVEGRAGVLFHGKPQGEMH